MNNDRIDRIEKKRKTANKVFGGFILFGFLLLFIGISIQIPAMGIVGFVVLFPSFFLSIFIDKIYKNQIRKLGGVPKDLNSQSKANGHSDTNVQSMVDEVRSTPIDSRQEDWDDYEKCPYCGEKNDKDATFCKRCGKKIK